MERAERDRLHDLIEALPERERMAVEARFYEQLTYREFAVRMECSPMYAWRLTQRALEMLGVELKAD